MIVQALMCNVSASHPQGSIWWAQSAPQRAGAQPRRTDMVDEQSNRNQLLKCARSRRRERRRLQRRVGRAHFRWLSFAARSIRTLLPS
jgi:hypothetical protein